LEFEGAVDIPRAIPLDRTEILMLEASTFRGVIATPVRGRNQRTTTHRHRMLAWFNQPSEVSKPYNVTLHHAAQSMPPRIARIIGKWRICEWSRYANQGQVRDEF